MVQKRFGNNGVDKLDAVTIRDIARAAGVAPSTVSAVVNGRTRQARISERTAQRVREVVETMGYHPDHVARSLRRGSTGLIGLAVSQLQDPFYPEFSVLFGQACRARGYAMFMTDLPDWEASASDEGLGKSLVDGVVLVDTRRSPWHPGHKVSDPTTSPLPTVLVAGEEWLTAWQMARSSHVLVLQTELAGRLAARHLWERGFRRFAYVSQVSPADLTPGHREFGFYDELLKLGADTATIRCAPLLTSTNAERNSEYSSSYHSMRSLIETGWCSGPDRVGVYVVNDFAALQVLRAVNEAGLAIPQQVGVVGTNGSQFGEVSHPPLTSISLNVAEVARLAVDRVLEHVSGRPGTKEDCTELLPSLLCRQST